MKNLPSAKPQAVRSGGGEAASGEADGIFIRVEGRAGRITLARPSALNALTWDMILAIESALIAWRGDDRVALVLIDAEGDRAFCAGGDIGEMHRTASAGDFDYGRRFWIDEYRLNALIGAYEKPYVALMQGFVMGGGVGVSCHGSHRVACGDTRIAMPECSIGLAPDVGGSFLLSRSPGRSGEYLALTGTRMNAEEACYAGFADFRIERSRWPELIEALCVTGDAQAVEAMAATPPREESPLESLRERIDEHFSKPSAMECLASLESVPPQDDADEWASSTARAIRGQCPLSAACAFALVGMNRNADSLREALDNELRFTWRSASHGEFVEGIRARIIDKDRNPKWRTPSLEEVSPEQALAMLAPLDEEAIRKLETLDSKSLDSEGVK